MSRYQHKKGQIKDNAIEALLHDPLFRNALKKIRKVREAICVKVNTVIEGTGRPVARKSVTFLPLAFCLLRMVTLFFQQIADFAQ